MIMIVIDKSKGFNEDLGLSIEQHTFKNVKLEYQNLLLLSDIWWLKF